MEHTLPAQSSNTVWYAYKNLVIVWLVLFWPIGLYGLWKTTVFPKPMKWKIAAGVTLFFLVFGGSQQFNLLLVFFLYPAGLYLMWKDHEIQPRTKWIVSGVAACFAVITLSVSQGGGGGGSGDCSEVMYKDGCTYYRDSSCNIIARSCE